jgi:transposase
LARYGQEFKDRAVARLLPPESASIKDVANEIGVGTSTLERWRSDALAQPGRERVWTAAARFDAVLTTTAMDEASKSAWCRSNGVYPQELATWRENALSALSGEAAPRTSVQETKQNRRKIKELEREIRRKDKALAETAALLVLSKKVAAIFNRDLGEDE